MTDADDERTVGELAEYCRTQAGLLAGRVDRMGEEASDLLDEIDEGVADLRARLDDRDDGATPASPETPTTPNPPADADDDGDDRAGVADLADAESDLREMQAAVEATETRMRLFQDLASDYLDLAEELTAGVGDRDAADADAADRDADDAGDADPLDADEAVRRVVEFEAERDAPAYFEERETLVELARRGDAAPDADAGERERE
ncbi:hypothetical protein [Halobaculum sp. EA56]|uniref:hypothetical protein n=1 Tax=Halobaculum sp. EA56 TaxID=3421648 RepID=UPI003EB9494D